VRITPNGRGRVSKTAAMRLVRLSLRELDPSRLLNVPWLGKEGPHRRSEGPHGRDGRTAGLLERERLRLLGLKQNLTEATEDAEHESSGDPSAGGHIADAGSELFERSRDLSIVEDLSGA